MIDKYFFKKIYDSIPSTSLKAFLCLLARKLKIPYLLVRLDTNNVCNLRCLMCPNSLPEFRQKPQFMGLDLFKKIAEDVFPLTRILDLSCSYEPLMTNNFVEYLHIASRYNKKGGLSFCTNAQLLNEEHIRVAAACRAEINISIDGLTKETYEHIRPRASFAQLLNSLEMIRDFKINTKSYWPKLRLNYTMLRCNLEELSLMADFCRTYGFATVQFRHVFLWPQFKEFFPESLYYHQPLYNSYVDNVLMPLKKIGLNIIHPPKYDLSQGSQEASKKHIRGGCAYPWFFLYIKADGTFDICKLGTFGNFINQSYWDVWNNNERLKNELDKIIKYNNEKCQHCIVVNAGNLNVNRKENYFIESSIENIL